MWLLLCAFPIIVECFVADQKQRVNMAPGRVLKVNSDAINTELIEEIQDLLTRVNKTLKDPHKKTRVRRKTAAEIELYDFLRGFTGILVTYEDKDLDTFFDIVDTEFKNNRNRGWKFIENLRTPLIRTFVDKKIDTLYDMTTDEKRKYLTNLSMFVENNTVIDYLNKFYVNHTMIFFDLLNKLKAYKISNKTREDLLEIVRLGLRFVLVDPYSRLDKISKKGVVMQLTMYLKEHNSPKPVNRRAESLKEKRWRPVTREQRSRMSQQTSGANRRQMINLTTRKPRTKKDIIVKYGTVIYVIGPQRKSQKTRKNMGTMVDLKRSKPKIPLGTRALAELKETYSESEGSSEDFGISIEVAPATGAPIVFRGVTSKRKHKLNTKKITYPILDSRNAPISKAPTTIKRKNAATSKQAKKQLFFKFLKFGKNGEVKKFYEEVYPRSKETSDIKSATHSDERKGNFKANGEKYLKGLKTLHYKFKFKQDQHKVTKKRKHHHPRIKDWKTLSRISEDSKQGESEVKSKTKNAILFQKVPIEPHYKKRKYELHKNTIGRILQLMGREKTDSTKKNQSNESDSKETDENGSELSIQEELENEDSTQKKINSASRGLREFQFKAIKAYSVIPKAANGKIKKKTGSKLNKKTQRQSFSKGYKNKSYKNHVLRQKQGVNNKATFQSLNQYDIENKSYDKRHYQDTIKSKKDERGKSYEQTISDQQSAQGEENGKQSAGESDTSGSNSKEVHKNQEISYPIQYKKAAVKQDEIGIDGSASKETAEFEQKTNVAVNKVYTENKTGDSRVTIYKSDTSSSRESVENQNDDSATKKEELDSKEETLRALNSESVTIETFNSLGLDITKENKEYMTDKVKERIKSTKNLQIESETVGKQKSQSENDKIYKESDDPEIKTIDRTESSKLTQKVIQNRDSKVRNPKFYYPDKTAKGLSFTKEKMLKTEPTFPFNMFTNISDDSADEFFYRLSDEANVKTTATAMDMNLIYSDGTKELLYSDLYSNEDKEINVDARKNAPLGSSNASLITDKEITVTLKDLKAKDVDEINLKKIMNSTTDSGVTVAFETATDLTDSK